MSSLEQIDLAAVLEHRHRLHSLPRVMEDDFADFRARLDEVEQSAENAVDRARAELDELDDENSSEEEQEGAKNHFIDCERYADGVFERTAQAKLEMQRIRAAFEQHYAAAERELDTLIDNYRCNHAHRIQPQGVTHAMAMAKVSAARSAGGNGGTTGRVHSALGWPLPTLPDGLVWMPMEELDWSEVKDDMHFKNAPRESMETMLRLFVTEILPMMRAPGGVTGEYLIRLDQRLGNGNGAGSLHFAWMSMIGGEQPITLDRSRRNTGPRYGWLYGRHRALLARVMGWTHIPAKVI